MNENMIPYKEVIGQLMTPSAQTLGFMMDDIFEGSANKDLSKLGGVKKLRSEVSFGGKERGMYTPVPENVSAEFLSKLLDEGLIALKEGVSKAVFEPKPEAVKEAELAAVTPHAKQLKPAR